MLHNLFKPKGTKKQECATECGETRCVREIQGLLGSLENILILFNAQDYIADIQEQRIPRPSEEEYKEFRSEVDTLCEAMNFDLGYSFDEEFKAYMTGMRDALCWVFGDDGILDLFSRSEG